MQLPLLPLPSPSNFELEEKLFTILDLKDSIFLDLKDSFFDLKISILDLQFRSAWIEAAASILDLLGSMLQPAPFRRGKRRGKTAPRTASRPVRRSLAQHPRAARLKTRPPRRATSPARRAWLKRG